MSQSLISLFLKAAHSRVGMVVQWLVGGGLGYLVSWLATLGIDLPPDIVTQLQAGLTAFGAFIVTDLIQRYQSKHNAALQEALKLPPREVDKWIGPKTIEHAAHVIDAIRSGRRL